MVSVSDQKLYRRGLLLRQVELIRQGRHGSPVLVGRRVLVRWLEVLQTAAVGLRKLPYLPEPVAITVHGVFRLLFVYAENTVYRLVWQDSHKEGLV